ncbi:MAG TPA: 50S ribosomal protein L11 methyltransferase [Gemmatimonadaceae bacterium]
MTWVALRVVPGSRRDEVIAALFAAGAGGLHEDGDAVVTHFPSTAEAQSVAKRLAAIVSATAITMAPVPDIDWTIAWRERLGDYALGSLTIVPPWRAAGHDPTRTIVIEPGMAFGTGDHPSTRGAGRLLEAAVRPGVRVADLGTGSGVLAIAAARHGAAHVFAIEIDPDALPNARANVERNGVAEVVHLLEGDAAVLLRLVAPVDVIVANIISSIILPLLPVMAECLRPGGTAIIAGLLAAERNEVRRALSDGGWRVLQEDLEDDWWSARIERA